MKKTIIGFLLVVGLLAGLVVWQGENILYWVFYDMDATMDLPENLYDDESLTNSESSDN